MIVPSAATILMRTISFTSFAPFVVILPHVQYAVGWSFSYCILKGRESLHHLGVIKGRSDLSLLASSKSWCTIDLTLYDKHFLSH